MAEVEEQAGHGSGADQRRPVRQHRARAGPLRGFLVVARHREPVARHLDQRAQRGGAQVEPARTQLGRAGDAHAVAQPRDRDLVRLVHQRAQRRLQFVAHQQRDRVSLDRVQRHAQAQRPQQRGTVDPGGGQHAVGSQHRRAALLAGREFDLQLATLVWPDACHLGIEVEGNPRRFGMPVQRAHEHRAVAGLILGQMQAAGQRRIGRQARFDAPAFLRADQLVWHVVLAQQRDGGACQVQVARGAEELQVALRLLVVDLQLAAQPVQAGAAVERQPLHAQLVGTVAFQLAFAQPARDPAPHRRVRRRAEHHRRLAREQRAQHLARHARRRPRRDIARRDHAGIAEAGFLRGRGAPFQHGHVEAGLAQVPRGTDADCAGADDDHMHAIRSLRAAHRHKSGGWPII
ncbi:hypothetical protein D9M69_457240 [compost metagenome]